MEVVACQGTGPRRMRNHRPRSIKYIAENNVELVIVDKDKKYKQLLAELDHAKWYINNTQRFRTI